MSRVSKWKLEKTKVKVVFRLQFHATLIPQTGWDKLFISFIPTDSVKATAKTTKAIVRNGTCKWPDPIYETTRLLQDSKNKQYDEKLYKIVVAMGTSRSRILGEGTINLADYVDAVKPSAATLPLHGCNFGTILYITIQLLTSKTGFREFEQQRELREKGLQSGPDSRSPGKTQSSEEAANYEDGKLSSREETNPNEECTDSVSLLDGSSNTSGSFYAEKHETSGTNEINSLKSNTSGHHQNTGSIGSTDELAMAFEENNRLKGSLELAESSLFDLKLEVTSLQSLADELSAETQKLSSQLEAKVSSTEKLAHEVFAMKSEFIELRDSISKLGDLKSKPSENRVDHSPMNMQLQLLKGISMVENKIRELQSKTHLVFHGGDPKLLYSELDALLDFLLGLKLENGNGPGLDLCQPESILPNTPGDIDALRGQIFDLVRELDESRLEKEALVQKANQMECYYEALIHELEENQKRLVGELQHVRKEHSAGLYELSMAKSEVDSLSHDLNQQAVRFEDERGELEALNGELERRAAASEAALRRARLNYSIAVDNLQEDLRLLSSQVTSMFEMNVNLIKQALPAPDVKKSSGGVILLQDLKRSLRVKENNFENAERELMELCSVNLELDLHSRALHESLREAMDDIHNLNEYKSSSILQCSDLALQNRALQDKISSTTDENYVLAQKLKDLQRELCSCLAENTELSHHLDQKGSENEKLSNEILTLKESSIILEAEFDELVFCKANLEESIASVRDRLRNLLAAYGTQFRFGADFFRNLDFEAVDMKDYVLRLEEVHCDVCARYRELAAENQNLRTERALADDEIVMTKRKLKLGLENMATKLDISSARVDELRAKIESVDSKMRSSFEVEEKHIDMSKVLLADLALLEEHMQESTCKNSHREGSILDSLAKELEMSELTISKLSQVNNDLKEASKILHDELTTEKVCRDDLEGRVKNLCLQLEQQNIEFMHVRKLAIELETEKNVFIEENKRDNSYHAGLESLLLELYECSLSTDVRIIYIVNHYEATIEEFMQKLVSSGGHLTELQKNYHDAEAKWAEEKFDLLTSLKTVRSHLEASEARNKIILDSNCETWCQLEECRNKLNVMVDAKQEVYDLFVSNKELEILAVILESKIHEQCTGIMFLEGSRDQLSMRLSEQVLKMEELEKLCTYLEKLKDKAEAECLVARTPSPGHDSLRIAFMKEQYETRVHELKQQVSILRKHGEEMLLRLQDAIDEIENRKKLEAVNVKRNEELLSRLSALEEELQLAVGEKSEKINAYDQTKAKLECALLSLECCKEEKEKLGSLLMELGVEKSRLAGELESVKAQLQDSRSSTKFGKDVCDSVNGTTPNVEKESKVWDGKIADSTEPGQLRIVQDAAQRLRYSMEHLYEELEKLKNKNKADSISHDVSPNIQVPQGEIMKLHKANEELESMFPPFNEISAGENALERVLALEIEVAEALKAKRKSMPPFQSSFLKHHGDDEAMLKSFRDINEIIKETLQLKETRASLEAELRDMHDRYSLLSLQFAEVEGDRQKLRITLNNTRSSTTLVADRSS